MFIYLFSFPIFLNFVTDLESDYDYIMSRALKSYRQHREKEKAETRRGPFKNALTRRHHLRPKTAPPARFVQSMRVHNMESVPKAANVMIQQVDAINAVSKANPVPDDDERYTPSLLSFSDLNLNYAHIEKMSRDAGCLLLLHKECLVLNGFNKHSVNFVQVHFVYL